MPETFLKPESDSEERAHPLVIGIATVVIGAIVFLILALTFLAIFDEGPDMRPPINEPLNPEP